MIFENPFLIKSLITSLWLGIAFALLGIFVLIRRMAFFSDGIAHASILGLALAFLLNLNFLIVALFSGIFFALLIYFLEKSTKINVDTLIGLIFVSALALGFIIISQKSGYQPDLLNFIMGNILILSPTDIYLTFAFSFSVICFLIFNFRQLFLALLDPQEARLRKINVTLYEVIFYVLLALAVILGIKIAGILLVTALLILPPAISSLISSNLKHFLILVVFFSIINIILGFILANLWNLPLSSSIVFIGSIIFFLIFFLKNVLKII